MSGKSIDLGRVVQQFYAETSRPTGRTRFLQYAVVFLHNNYPAYEICSFPSETEYRETSEELRDYRIKHWATKRKILRCLARFGEHLILHCIYPMMSLSQPSPSTGGSRDKTPQLSKDCLERDGHRCAITGKFDVTIALKRSATPETYVDDDGNPLSTHRSDFDHLEVAHIVPHALGWGNDTGTDAINSRLNVFTILEMFISGTLEAYHGTAIDSPENAITIELNQHRDFGLLRIYFEPQQGTQNSYTVCHGGGSVGPFFNFARKHATLRTPTDIPFPDPNLLAIHGACARIAHATGTNESCLSFLRDLEDGSVEADGSTSFDQLLAYRLLFHQDSETSQKRAPS